MHLCDSKTTGGNNTREVSLVIKVYGNTKYYRSQVMSIMTLLATEVGEMKINVSNHTTIVIFVSKATINKKRPS